MQHPLHSGLPIVLLDHPVRRLLPGLAGFCPQEIRWRDADVSTADQVQRMMVALTIRQPHRAEDRLVAGRMQADHGGMLARRFGQKQVGLIALVRNQEPRVILELFGGDHRWVPDGPSSGAAGGPMIASHCSRSFARCFFHASRDDGTSNTGAAATQKSNIGSRIRIYFSAMRNLILLGGGFDDERSRSPKTKKPAKGPLDFVVKDIDGNDMTFRNSKARSC